MSTYYTPVNDQFSGASLDTTIWEAPSGTGKYPAGVSVSSGQLNLKSSTTLSDYTEIRLLESATDGTPLRPASKTTAIIAETKLTPNGQRTSGGVQYAAYFGIQSNSTPYIEFQVYSSTNTGASTTYTIETAYWDGTSYVIHNSVTTLTVGTSIYLRISIDSSGSALYEYSTNGTTWTTATNPSPSFSFPSNSDAFVYAIYQNYNVLGSQATANFDYITFQTTDAPKVSFTATPVSGVNPLTVTFTDTSPGTFTAWSWDFGDGNTPTSQNPTHTYTTGGVYNVSLEATDYVGTNTETISNLINVGAGLTGISSLTGVSSITFS